jgi:hypothetical protein
MLCIATQTSSFFISKLFDMQNLCNLFSYKKSTQKY